MFSEALFQLYAEPVPPLNVSDDQHPDDENTDPSHVLPSALANNNKRRRPTDISDMVDSSFSCCKKSLRCVEAFINGTADVRELRAEQKAFSALAGRSRAEFVNTMIPASRPGKNKRAMRAGGRVVCNTFFKQALGVSNNLIQIQKTTLGHQQSPQGMIRAANRYKEDESASLPGVPTRNTVVVIIFVWSFCLQLPR